MGDMKPCPFCGGQDIGPTMCWGEDNDEAEAVSAVCRDCGAQGPLVKVVEKTYDSIVDPNSRTTAASIAAWNGRHG